MAQTQKAEKYLEHLTTNFHFFNKSEKKTKRQVIIERVLIGILMTFFVTGMSLAVYLDSTNQNYNHFLIPTMDEVVHNGDFSYNTLNKIMTAETSKHPLAFSRFFSPITENNWEYRIYDNAIPQAFDRWGNKLMIEKITIKGDAQRQVIYNEHLKEFNISYDAYFSQIKQRMKPAGLD